MSFGEINKGDRWGRIECIEVDRRTKFDETLNCLWENALCYILKCDCGQTVELFQVDYRGKRRIKDCGCGLAKDDSQYIVVGVSMPVRTRNEINKYATRHKVKFSRAVVELIEKGNQEKEK